MALKGRIAKKISEKNNYSDSQTEMIRSRIEEGNRSFRSKMPAYLSAINDGIIAILITVMMLEIPYPLAKQDYLAFIWAIAVFLVSFFIIADFWYNNKRIFQLLTAADHLVIVANFLFLAALALIPVMTKWIMNSPDKYSTLHFGIVYLLTILLQQFLLYAIVRKTFRSHLKDFAKIFCANIAVVLAISIVLIVLGWFFPKWVMILYILIPVIRFFVPDEFDRMAKKADKEKARSKGDKDMSGLTELPTVGRPEGEEELKKFRERIHRFETENGERFTGSEPVNAIDAYNELLEDYEGAFAKYYEKRIRLCGTVTKIEPDSFDAPSFQFTDGEKSRCYALIVFPDDSIYEKVKEGDYAEIIGNVTIISEPYGLVVKKCELLDVK